MPTTLCMLSLVFYRGMWYVAPTRGFEGCGLGRSSSRDGELVKLIAGLTIAGWRRICFVGKAEPICWQCVVVWELGAVLERGIVSCQAQRCVMDQRQGSWMYSGSGHEHREVTLARSARLIEA